MRQVNSHARAAHARWTSSSLRTKPRVDEESARGFLVLGGEGNLTPAVRGHPSPLRWRGDEERESGHANISQVAREWAPLSIAMERGWG
jgi:hypothetical protein